MRPHPAVALGLLSLLAAAAAAVQAPAPSPSPTPLGRPCENDPKSRALDFWVGDWDLRPSGGPPGPPSRNRIERVEDGCVIAEHYTTSRGYSGRSINAYDATKKRWQQTWMDNQGGVHTYFGEARDGKFHYEADGVYVPGQAKLVKARMTYFKEGPDRLRHLGEHSTDDGKTWTKAYDFIYTRRPAP